MMQALRRALAVAFFAPACLLAWGVLSAQNVSDSAAVHAATPDIGTKMPDGRVYAGLSMKTGKPMYIAPAGGKVKDGTIYAGISPDTSKDLFLTAADAPGAYTWADAVAYCKALADSGHHDWRVPTLGELAVQFNNRADIGGYNESAKLKNATGYYWTSLEVGDDEAWAQRFNDGWHEHYSKAEYSLLRCVR
jgi:hypothetical protein